MSEAGPTPEEVSTARDLLAELVDIPSPSGSEGAIVDRIEQLCGGWGLATSRIPTETGRDCLLAGPRDPALVIAAHVDTINPPWPARAVVDGDIVRGLGSVDDKGGVVACLLAAERIESSGGSLDELGVSFAFPVDEEMGGSGSRALAIELRPRFAIALETTGFATGSAETGGVEARIVFTGRAAHGALTDVGDNAITPAIAFVNALPGLDLERHSHDLLGRSSAEICAIEAGNDFNTTPDRCTIRLEIKVVPGQGAANVVADLERLAGEHGGRVELIEVTQPFVTDPGSRLVRELETATVATVGAHPGPVGVPAWTDAHNFVVFGGSEAVVFGPGDFTTAHTEDEHIDCGRVVECAHIFSLLAESGWRT